MAEVLTSFLRESAAAPFSWGATDCCAWVGRWVALRRGIDPVEPLHGRYRTERGAARHIHRAGGLVPLARLLMANAGLSETAAPKPGDAAIVDTPWGPAGAIRTERGFACKSPTGLVVAPFPLLVAWSV